MVHASAEEILRFCDGFDIDESFVPFVRNCRASGVPVMIISEGLDFYIKRILARYDLADIPVICNLGFLENETIRIEFPHVNRTCRHCGSCKGERMSEHREKAIGALRIAFVGDGYSDACAAREADVLFAKDDLEEYCIEHKIAYNRFKTFYDVTEQLTQQRYLVA